MAVGEGGRDNGIKELISTTTALGNKKIDLSRKSLTEIPVEVLDLTQLEFLYLEGNYITEIPPVLFERLPSLKWLDLRNNHITEVPSAIGSHKALRNLLLEGNDIKELPLELGFAKLSGLNIASNPLEMPPSSVIERGTQEVLKFLREKYAYKMQMTEDQAALSLRPTSSSSSEDDPMAYNYESQSRWYNPPARKPRRNSDTSEPYIRPVLTPMSFHQPPTRPDLKRMEYDRQRVHVHRHSTDIRRDSSAKEQSSPEDSPKRMVRAKMTRSKGSGSLERINYSASASPRFPNYEAKAAEQQQLAITAMLNEKEGTILQKLKDKQALNDWRDRTRKLRQQKEHLAKFKKPLKVDVNAPYGTENNMKEEKPNVQYVAKLKEILEDKDKDAIRKAINNRELEDRIKLHLDKIHVHRHKHYEDITEELESARRNLEMAQKFQKELDERRALDYRLRAFTGEDIPLATTSKGPFINLNKKKM